MSFDLSKAIYTHSCGQLPCTCVRVHKPLEQRTWTCCEEIFYTYSKYLGHRSLLHSIPLPVENSAFDIKDTK